MNAQWDQIQEIFQGCLENAPVGQDRFLNQVCGDDQALRQRVESLLENDCQNATNGFLDWPDQTEAASRRLAKPADRIGDYRIERLVGSGSSGEVYRAVRESDGTVAAVKLLRPWQSDESAVARFQREAEALSKLSHPNIAKLIEMGKRDDGLPFIVMQFIDGMPLNRICETRPVSNQVSNPNLRTPDIRTKVNWFLEICSAVAAAHEAQILHRDLKPSNIMIDTDGKAIVTDFGLARFFGTESRQTHLTTTGRSLGTPRFMAPEQFNSDERLGMTTDVYGLGAVLYYMLTGNAPFESENIFEIAGAVRDRQPTHPRVIDNKLDRDLSTICLHCLSKKPVDRYQTVSELFADIENWRSGKPIAVRTPNSWQRLVYWARRNPRLATMSGLLLVSVVAALISTTVLWQQSLQKLEQENRQKSTLLALVNMATSKNGERFRDSNTTKIQNSISQIVDLGARLIEQQKDVGLRKQTGVAWLELCDALRAFGDEEQAIRSCTAALEIFQGLSDEFPESIDYKFDVFHCLNRLRRYGQAFDLIEQIVELDQRKNNYYLGCLAGQYATKSINFIADGRYEDAIDSATKGEQIVYEILDRNPIHPDFFRKTLVELSRERFRAHFLAGQIDAGKSELRSSVDVAESIYNSDDPVPHFEKWLIDGLNDLVSIDLIEGKPDLALLKLKRANLISAEYLNANPESGAAWAIRERALTHQAIACFELQNTKQLDHMLSVLREHFLAWRKSGVNNKEYAARYSVFLLNFSIEDASVPGQVVELLRNTIGNRRFLRGRARLAMGDLRNARADFLGSISRESDIAGRLFVDRYLKIIDAIEQQDRDMLANVEFELPLLYQLQKVTAHGFYSSWFVFRHFDNELEVILKANGIDFEDN